MNDYRVCSRCVMDTSAKDIIFDDVGICNYCSSFLKKQEILQAQIGDPQMHRDSFIAAVKADGKGKEYDCIMGVSGGVDSSYALYLAVKHGLRPLAVHLDNGWNTELASHNIATMVESLGVDLYTHVIDWEENRDLQLSFFKANVIDIELLMDNAMLALNYQMATKYGLKYILSGCNQATEGMSVPQDWCHYKFDVYNIKRIHQHFGSVPIKTHPLLSTMEYVWDTMVRRIKWVPFLDYFPYNKQKSIAILQKEFGYKSYPYKHYESVFTRFYQGYILPQKFGVDKRRVHLATLVVSGQMTREDAMQLLEHPPYPDSGMLESDRIFIIKKLGFTDECFLKYMEAPSVPHQVYGSERWLWDIIISINKIIGFVPTYN